MPKQIFIAACVVDSEEFGYVPDRHEFVTFLADRTQQDASDWIVWDSAADFVKDHTERGPIDLAWLLDDGESAPKFHVEADAAPIQVSRQMIEGDDSDTIAALVRKHGAAEVGETAKEWAQRFAEATDNLLDYRSPEAGSAYRASALALHGTRWHETAESNRRADHVATKSDLCAADALRAALTALDAAGNKEAAATIAMILKQRGVSHFDSSADKLTDLIDIVVFG